jgi:outer membrane receptor protein involved in Fe transport
MKNVVVLLLILQSFVSQATSIKGVVATKKEKTAIDFATVALLNLPDSSIATGSNTQNGGKFNFENIAPGRYYLKASFVGYSSSGEEIQVKADDKLVTSDTIFLSETTKQIGEAIVTGRKIEGKELVDRTVYSIPGEIAKASPNAYDLLKKVPSIQVDYNDNITLNGSNNFIIQVDGKQRDKEYLARLQPADIETIEVITNPSGKYEGNIDGVLNIKLKQEARYGISGNVNAGARPRAQTSGNLNGSLDYAMGKATLYVSGYSWFNDLNIKYNNNTKYNFNSKMLPIDSAINSNGTGTYKFFVGAINAGVDYYIDKYHTFSFNTSYKPLINITSLDQSNDIVLKQVQAYYQTFSSSTNTNSGELNSTAFYRQQFEKPLQELTIEGSFYDFAQGDEYKTDKSTYYTNTNPLNNLNRYEKNNSGRNSLNLKADYVQPFGMDTKIETGVQLYWQQMGYNATYRQLTLDTSLLNNFVYTEWREAAYAGFTTAFDKLSFQTTFRVENSNISTNDGTTSSENYSTFLPSANIMYKFTSKQNVKLTYNRRINRPSLTQLSPAEIVNSTDNITQGNPTLKPEYRDRLQFTYTLNIEKSYVSPYIYYDLYNHKVDNINIFGPSPLVNHSTSLAIAENLLTGEEHGVGLNALIYFININYKYFKGHFNEYKYGPVVGPATNYSSYSISGWAYAPLPWKMSIFAFGNYQGRNINAQGTSVGPFFYGSGARKEFGNHSFGLFWLLPGISNLTVIDNNVSTPQFTSHSKASFDARYFIQVTYAYKFNKGKAVKKVTRNTEVESDSKKGIQQ